MVKKVFGRRKGEKEMNEKEYDLKDSIRLTEKGERIADLLIKEGKMNWFDLVWIIPELIGSLFITICIPVILLRDLQNVGFFSPFGCVYLGIIFLILKQFKSCRLDKLIELLKEKVKKK